MQEVLVYALHIIINLLFMEGYQLIKIHMVIFTILIYQKTIYSGNKLN